MASGDVISDVYLVTAGTDRNFQPAGTNEFIILQINCGGDVGTSYLFNGTNYALFTNGGADTRAIIPPSKLCINNTNYLKQKCSVGSVDMGYSGIQTK